MMPSRGMGDINPSKMPKGKKTARRDDTDFTQYAEGGLTTFGKEAAKATHNIVNREHAEAHYKKEAAKEKEIELGPKVPGKKKGGEVWDKPRPAGLGKPKKMSPAKKSSAKAMAKAAGRPYPNLVDNMRAARKK